MAKNSNSSGKKRLSAYEKHVKRQKQIKIAFYSVLGVILLILVILIILSE